MIIYPLIKTISHELINQLGSVKLNNLSPLILLSHYNYLRDRGNYKKEIKEQKRRLTENTILRHYRVIIVALKQEANWQLLSSNPNERVKSPRKLKVESKFFDLEQTKALLIALIPGHHSFRAL